MTDDLVHRTCRGGGRFRLLILGTLFLAPPSRAENPFFVTYTHQMEEPRNLEINTKNITGNPEGGNRFTATALEFEYGVNAWWTSEFYLDGQSTRTESTVFTGF